MIKYILIYLKIGLYIVTYIYLSYIHFLGIRLFFTLSADNPLVLTGTEDLLLYMVKQYLSGLLGIGLALFIYINDVPAPFPWLWIIVGGGAGCIVIYSAQPFAKKIEGIYLTAEATEMHLVIAIF